MTGAVPAPPSDQPPPPRRLDSWKEVAAYLRRTIRTVQRWEREQGLPVHRLHHNRQGSIYAYTNELDEWWARRASSLDAADDPEHATSAATDDEGVAPVAANPMPSAGAPAPAATGRRFVTLVLLAVLVGATGLTVTLLLRQQRFHESARLCDAGRAFWNLRTVAGFEQARQTFEQSIALNPRNARAHAGLADTYSLLEGFGIMAPAEALPKALAEAERAIGLDPTLGEAHASLSMVLWEKGQRTEALLAAERAIALDPDYATAHHWYALYLQDSGRYQAAVEEGRKAVALAPDSGVIGADLAIMLRNAGRPHEARAVLEDLVGRQPSSASLRVELANAYRREGRFDKALEQQAQAVTLGDTSPASLARLAWLRGRNGLERGALELARQLWSMSDRGEHVPPHVMVEALIGAGDLDSAARLVAKGIEQEAFWISHLVVNDHSLDVYRPLIEDARWARLDAGARAIAARIVKAAIASRPAPDPPARPPPTQSPGARSASLP